MVDFTFSSCKEMGRADRQITHESRQMAREGHKHGEHINSLNSHGYTHSENYNRGAKSLVQK